MRTAVKETWFLSSWCSRSGVGGSKSLVIRRDATGVKSLGLEGSQSPPQPTQAQRREGTEEGHTACGGAMGASLCPLHSIQLPRFGSLCSAVTTSCAPRWELLRHMRKLAVAIVGGQTSSLLQSGVLTKKETRSRELSNHRNG